MRKRKKWMAVLASMCLLMTSVPTQQLEAAAVESVNQSSVYQKQMMRGTCTLSASAMMLRRAALYDGNEKWAKIKESSIRKKAWLEGAGLRWEFSYAGMSVSHATLPGGSKNKSSLKKLLAQHPEGIVLYDRSVPHAVLLTDYTKGKFYCADPTTPIAKGRISIDQAYRVSIEKATSYWFVRRTAFTVGNLKYQVLNTPDSKKEVQVTGMVDQTAKSVSIPSAVSYGKQKYTVTRIAENAFKKNQNIEKVTIGKNVKSMGAGAFAGALHIKKIKNNAVALKDIGKDAFPQIAKTSN
ncbi:MAG: leucine-rich repeat protein [Lachnospiraceae bacterium]